MFKGNSYVVENLDSSGNGLGLYRGLDISRSYTSGI